MFEQIFGRKPNKESKQISQLFSKDIQDKFKNLKTQENVKTNGQTPSQQHENNENADERTIFVGNVHLSVTHKELKKQFSSHGKIDKVWFRSIPTEANKMGKKASHILKKYVQGASSMNAYIRFESIESAIAACQLNGSKMKQLTLRVSLCEQKEQDFQTTIFVGNLPYNIQEEELRNHFQNVGAILNVRIIKDKFTFAGLGIGYVRFQTKEEMKIAIQSLNQSELKERKIRVKRAVKKSRKDKKFRNVMRRKQTKLLKSQGKSTEEINQHFLKKMKPKTGNAAFATRRMQKKDQNKKKPLTKQQDKKKLIVSKTKVIKKK